MRPAHALSTDEKPSRPPRVLSVVRDPLPHEVGARIDWSTWYLTDEEDRGESSEQEQIIFVLKSSLKALARTLGWPDVHIAGDQFFAWVPHEPNVRVSPDVYLLDDPPPPPHPEMWETWKPGRRPPRFAVEVVSAKGGRRARWEKDYEEAPAKYALLGTEELVIFDPEAASGRGSDERVALQLYRRESDGAFVRVYRGAGPTWSEQIDAGLVVVHEGPVARLRLCRDMAGHDLVPTAEEALVAADEALAAERQARSVAEQDAARLRAELAALRRDR